MQILDVVCTYFEIDELAIIMMMLVAFVATTIGSFSMRYLKGDRKQREVFVLLPALAFSIFCLVSADHLLVLLASWAISNSLLVKLMLHKSEWRAARQSALLALKNFALGFFFLSSAILIFYLQTKETSIQAIVLSPMEFSWKIIGGTLLLLAAMTQSAIWPFHKWLTSSLNSPTPVSALMHAGLVNGGGFLLVRFAPILLTESGLLKIAFVLGMITAVTGTLWKLMQTDIKRMLASSTMAQMGFMIAQCGLGLFPAAVAHLCWHGLFKAYLFLSSGSAAKEKRLDLDYPPSLKHLSLALLCGSAAAYMFAITSNKPLQIVDTQSFPLFLALIAGTQFSLPIIRGTSKMRLPIAVIAALLIGCVYGGSVHLIEQSLPPMSIWVPQPLNILHLFAGVCLLCSWLAMLFIRSATIKYYPSWLLKLYVQALNASQPAPNTITAHRNAYQF